MASDAEPLSAQSEREEAGTECTGNEECEIEFEHDEIDSEGEDYTPLCSNEDPEKQHDYKEYKRLEKSIKCQNETLENLKAHIQTLKAKTCLTPTEQKDLKQFNQQLQLEMEKLRCLVERAIRLQNLGSRRHYRGFPLVTTFDEDMLNLQAQTSKNVPKPPSNWRASGGESSELDKSCSYNDESQMSLSEERKLMKEILAALKECSNLKDCHNHNKQKQQHNIACSKSNSLEKMKNKINCLQQTICKLKEELNIRNVKRNQSEEKSCAVASKSLIVDPGELCLGKVSGKTANFEQLKENYMYLLTEFSKKDEQLKDLTKKLKNSCAHCAKNLGGDIAQDNSDESELILLRNRVNEMKEEQIEFKCLMKEQSSQLEEYRNKYLTAQQQVEEQTALIEKLNMNNKRIEKQINQEIKEIRNKFQEKLSELLQYPRLLENEQLKFAQKSKEKDDLENKLLIVCKELKNLKSKTQNNNTEDCKPQLMKCQQELAQVKKNIEEIQKQRDMFCEQLKLTKEDLDTLRCESAKIIARTKERSDLIKQQQQEHIDRLEKQLAQCRATACLSVNDREQVIREMQGQLNTLSYSFDAAQKQIKTLKNHIAFMSNENTFTAKC